MAEGEDAGAKLATAYYELIPSMAGAETSITEQLTGATAGAGGKVGNALGSGMLGTLKRFAGPIAAIATVAGLAEGAKKSMEAFEGLVAQTNALQRIAGGTKEQVSGLVGAFQLAGVPVDTVSGSLTKFANNLGKASADGTKTAAMSQLLGTNMKDAAGNVKPMAEILPGLADKFKSMPDGAEKTALAVQLFGRSGTQLLPFLNRGSEGIAQFTAQAKKMGLTVDDVSAKTFASARQSMRDYQAATQGLSVTLGGDLVPVVDGVQNIFRSAMLPVLTTLTGILHDHRGAFISFGETLEHVGEIVGGKVSGAMKALGPIFGTVGATLGPLFKSLGESIGPLIGPFLKLASTISPTGLVLRSLAPVLPQLIGVLGQLASVVGGALSTVFKALMPVISQVAKILTGELSQTFKMLVPIITRIATVLGGVLGTTIKELTPVIVMIVQVFGQVLKAVTPLIEPLLGLLTPILSLIAPLLQLVGPILKPLISLFTSLLTPILQLITPLINLLVPVLQVVVTVLTAIITGVVDVITWFVQLVTGSQTAQKQLGQVWNGVLGFFEGIWKGIIGFFADGWKNIIRFFADLPKNIQNLLSGAGGWLVDTGKNLIQGLLNGATGLLKNIGSFFISVLPSWIVTPFKAALGIHSPSTVFAGLGGNIVDGLLGGVTAGQGAVNAALGSMVDVRGVSFAAQSSTAAVGAAGNGMPDTMTLLDADGSILARVKVLAGKALAAASDARKTDLSTGTQKAAF